MKKLKVWQLVLILAVVVLGGVLFVGAAAGWFSGVQPIAVDAEYICTDDCELMELSAEQYEALVQEKGSFVVFVDQPGCHTADELRGFVKKWSAENGVRFYRMWFSDVKETTLYNNVRYYPSVAVVSRGKVVAWRRADADADAGAYNEYEVFSEWMGRYVTSSY